MTEQERTFISFVEDTHPLLQEMPVEFRKLWFKGYQHLESKNILFLQMERVYQNSGRHAFLELLTLEIADMEALLEWEEECPNKQFVAIDPYYVFFDGVDQQGRGMFSVGSLDLKTMRFISELEIFITPHEKGIAVDFQEDRGIEIWYAKK